MGLGECVDMKPAAKPEGEQLALERSRKGRGGTETAVGRNLVSSSPQLRFRTKGTGRTPSFLLLMVSRPPENPKMQDAGKATSARAPPGAPDSKLQPLTGYRRWVQGLSARPETSVRLRQVSEQVRRVRRVRQMSTRVSRWMRRA